MKLDKNCHGKSKFDPNSEISKMYKIKKKCLVESKNAKDLKLNSKMNENMQKVFNKKVKKYLSESDKGMIEIDFQIPIDDVHITPNANNPTTATNSDITENKSCTLEKHSPCLSYSNDEMSFKLGKIFDPLVERDPLTTFFAHKMSRLSSVGGNLEPNSYELIELNVIKVETAIKILL